MIAYHGTETKFEKFDFSKSQELGVCFTTQVNAARAYGEIVYTVDLNVGKTLDLTNKNDALKLIGLCPEMKASVQELADDGECADIDEFLNEYWGDFINYVQEITDRVEYLEAAKGAGYDCVLIEDFTDGDEHDAYIALSPEIIKKVTG